LKTAKWWLSAALLIGGAADPLPAALFLGIESDLRASLSDLDGGEASLYSFGGSGRWVFSDPQGDRLTLFVRGEWAEDLEDDRLHEAYGEWKGPMGRWNIAAGRVALPWGLRTEWSPDRMPYRSPYEETRAPDSDTGLRLRGTVGAWDYGVALTQGYGMETPDSFPGPGNLTGRIGWTPGLDGDFTMGLSASEGTVPIAAHGHEDAMDSDDEDRTALALDATLHFGRGTYRLEGGARHPGDRWRGTLFGAADYAIGSRLTVQAAGQAYESEDSQRHRWGYIGLALPVKWMTLRGGYEYEKMDEEDHRVVVQLYSVWRWVR